MTDLLDPSAGLSSLFVAGLCAASWVRRRVATFADQIDSFHQHDVVPMAFRAPATAGVPSLSGAVEAWRAWLSRNDPVDRRAGMIWRSIVRDEGPARRLARHSLRWAGPRIAARPAGSPSGLRVNREARPHEWEWYLFTSSVEGGSPPQEPLA